MPTEESRSELSAGAILRPEEMSAMEFANAVYGAEAKLQAAQFFGKVGLAQDKIAESLRVVGAAVDASIGFEDKKEIADHFRALGRFVGDASLSESATVDFVPIGIQTNNGHHNGKNGASAESETNAVAPKKQVSDYKNTTKEDGEGSSELSKQQQKARRNFLTKIFGEANADFIDSLTDDQFEGLGLALSDAYIGLTIMRLNEDAKQLRASQMRQLLKGRDYKDIAESMNVSKGSIYLALNKMTESITKRIDQDTLQQILQSVTEKSPNTGEETDSYQQAIDNLATALHYEDEEYTQTLHKMFDIKEREVTDSEVADEIRDDLNIVINLMRNNKKLSDYNKLDDIELGVFSVILGTESRHPISAFVIDAHQAEALGDTGRSLDEVIVTGLTKIYHARITARD